MTVERPAGRRPAAKACAATDATDDAGFDRVRETVLKASALWVPIMGLTAWSIRHVFLESFDWGDAPDDFKTTASAEARWNYEQAKVKWLLPSAVRHSDAELERTVVHELMHIVLAPEQEHVKVSKWENIELATERAAKALLRARAINLGELPEAACVEPDPQ